MDVAPIDIKAKRDEGVLQVTWPGGEVVRYPFKFLRSRCGCAVCVDEFTGERRLDPARVHDDITVQSMQLVGSYAVHIAWSDGHDTGFYTWKRLRELESEVPSA